jgi:catechol 2,3-dioxygenase-like lactoylglutathione lyase family enzyme
MSTAFGTFLELSIPTGDIQKSLAFYQALGFTELATGDIRSHFYAVVTDGHIAIGLHGGGLEEPALSFVRPELARHVRGMTDAGHAFEFMRLGAEEFNEAALRSPDGQLILMMEARTFSPGDDEDIPVTLIGRANQLSLTTADSAATLSFFEEAGFLASDDEAVGETLLTTEGLSLSLSPINRGRRIVLHFASPDPVRTIAKLSVLDIATERGAEGTYVQAPEGTRLVIG